MKNIFATRGGAALIAILTTATFGCSLFNGVASAAADTNYHAHHLKMYVALGDSVAAGVGLPQSAAASSEDKACGRSPVAYAGDLGAMFARRITATNIACTGATTANLTTQQTVNGVTVQPQLDTAFQNGTPDFLSLTVGANDAHWADFIGLCYAASCDTPANTAAVQAYLATLKTDLGSALQSIAARSYGRPPVTVVTGYYNPMSAQCAAGPITASEVDWVAQQTAALNNTIETAAAASGFAQYAPVSFAGHDICSTDPWLQRPGVAGETNPFHPNATGQQQMAEAVLQAVRN